MKSIFEQNTTPLFSDFSKLARRGSNGSKNAVYSKPQEVLVISTFPPRECGIATYTNDLINALEGKFPKSFKFSICALENSDEVYEYPTKVKYKLNTDDALGFNDLADQINANKQIKLVVLQHEFGLFSKQKEALLRFLESLNKIKIVCFHTILPRPSEALKLDVASISRHCSAIVVMTNNSKKILTNDYEIVDDKIFVISHGVHLISHQDKVALKRKHELKHRTVLSTFGLISEGKNIETTLQALPSVVDEFPEVTFLIIGKTHPNVVKNNGEQYREFLVSEVARLGLNNHVRWVNEYLPLNELLEYLQLSDVYLFTSKDPNQAVSGTFSYAVSCGCPIISTPIPHAIEVLGDDAGVIVDFENPTQLSEALFTLLNNEKLRNTLRVNGLQKISSAAWENSAIAHARLFKKLSKKEINLQYALPDINLKHIKKLTTSFAMLQFSVINQPDPSSGYTLDDNARALVAMCMHFELTNDKSVLPYIELYLEFIGFCQQANGRFLNYVDINKSFTNQNDECNLDDANGRAIWALGVLVGNDDLFSAEIIHKAEDILNKALAHVNQIHSTRAMAFIIKGLHYRGKHEENVGDQLIIKQFANRLQQMYEHESESGWRWFEPYLTYANSILPEAMLCAWEVTGEESYRKIADQSFEFLLHKTFKTNEIKVVSNRGWMHKVMHAKEPVSVGEQAIDVAYTILALSRFNEIEGVSGYALKMHNAFDWFLGKNRLQQTVYNPSTGGCYDGLEDNHVNLNQGAESTLSYLLARLTIEKHNMLLKKSAQISNSELIIT